MPKARRGIIWRRRRLYVFRKWRRRRLYVFAERLAVFVFVLR
jgi:hypothetical protein